LKSSHAAAAVLQILGVLSLLVAACGPSGSTHAPGQDSAARILLFAGRGTSPNDVAALEGVLSGAGLHYSTATSRQLNDLDESELATYRLLVVPGGNFEAIGHALDTRTTMRLRGAVAGGLNYLGVCAGAFFAGHSPFNGLDLTSGVRFPFYAAENRGVRKTAVAVSTPEGAPIDQYWEDGPQLTGWGEVVARYPDGTPAVVQGGFGKGWVVLTGVHPEAPESWRRGITFTTPVAASHAYAATLIDAAMNGRRLPHY
jgi:glutamine amidotransferase-like uncharacterized protein